MDSLHKSSRKKTDSLRLESFRGSSGRNNNFLDSKRSPAGSGQGSARSSARTSGRTMVKPSSHWKELFKAVLYVTLYMGNTVTTALLFRHYMVQGYDGSARALAYIWILETLVHLVFDAANHGRFKLFLLDILHVRVFVEFIGYLREWGRRKGISWRECHFMFSLSFESFFGFMPSLMIQAYIFISEPEAPITRVQLYAFGFTCLYALYILVGIFRYLSVNRAAYLAMCFKAVLNSAIRTMLTALLFNTLLEGIFPYVGVSFLLGMLIYWYALHTIRINTNDVAFKKALSHRLVAVLVSLNMLYVSFPFAPAFATHEWWTGYMQAEVKMLMENLCICGLTMFTLWDTMDKKTFYSISAFVVSQLVANLALLKYLSWSVHGQLEIRRRDGTTRLIAQELKNICRFIESDGQQANKTRRPRKKTVAVTKHYNQAAKVIQSAWRERSRKLSVLQAFGGGQGKSIGIARTTSFLSGTGRRSLTRSGSVTSFKRPSIDMIAEEVTSDDEVAVETIMSVPLQKRKQLNLGSRRNKKQPIVDLSASLGRLEEVSDDDE